MTSGLGALIGPAVIGVAAWCAAGRITVTDPVSASFRLAAPAGWWVAVAAAGLAALVPAWRRRPALTLPALLTTLPWWPIALPPLALLFTGPLAWLPIGCSLAAASVDGHPAFLRSRGPHPPLRTLRGSLRSLPRDVFFFRSFSPSPRHAMLVAAALTFLGGLATAWSVAPRVPGGDEPHYLVITESLLSDGDLRIENNHARGDSVARSLRPDFLRRGRDGQIYSIHAPGVAVVVLPGFVAAGYRGAQGIILLLAAIGGALVWGAAWRASGQAGAAWFAWAAVAGSSTALLQSVLIFPDGAGAFVVAAGVWLLVRLAKDGAPVGTRAVVLVSSALAALPWLHTRFAVIAAGLGAAIAWRLWTVARQAGDRRSQLRPVLVFLAVPLASALGWFAYFQLIYGTPNPSAPYGSMAESSWLNVPGGLFGLLFDQQFGLLIFAPVLALAFVECLRRSRDDEAALNRWCVAIAVAYLATSATYWMWWAGKPATPARLATAVLPLMAVPLASSWARATPAGKAVRTLLLLITLLISGMVIGIGRGELAWSGYDAQARWLEWLGPVVNLPRALPSFFWQLDPSRRATEVPFFVHLAVCLAVITVAVVVGRWWLGRPRAGTSSAIVAFGAMPLVLAALAQAGWWLNQTNGLDPARSQIATLARLARGDRALTIAPATVAAAGDAASRLVITSEQAGVHDPAVPWGTWRDVPPGTYTLEIQTARPQRGVLNLVVGSTSRPWRELTIQALSRQSMTLRLPAGATAVTFAPDRDLAATGGAIVLKPQRLDRLTGPLARSVMSYQAADVFFLDGGTFVEPDGFWVRGGQTARFVLQPAPQAPLTLHLSNGAVANVVELELDGEAQVLSLGGGDRREIPVPNRASGVAWVTLRSRSGFRPSDQGGADGRFLGVRVEVR